MNIFLELEFDWRCRRLTAVIGAFAAALVLSAVICRAGDPPAALRYPFAMLGSLSACGMLTVYAAMAAGAFAKRLPDKAAAIFCAADLSTAALKLFFLLATCGKGLPIACAALIIDAVLSRIYLFALHDRLRDYRFN